LKKQIRIKIKNFYKFNSKYIFDDSILRIYTGKYVSHEVFIVMPYLEHEKFSDFYLSMTMEDIKIYMFQLLNCLDQVHRVNIVHRDLKPDNFLYNSKTKKCLLIDFGLSDVVSNYNY